MDSKVPVTVQPSKKTKGQMPKQQKIALQLLIGFFVIMAIFTVLSRAADSLTIPVVSVQNPAAKSLEHSVSADGAVEAQKELSLRTDTGIRIEDVLVSEGQAVKQGDVLLTFDLEDTKEQLETKNVELKKKQLELKAARLKLETTVDSTTDSALTKEERAQQDYERAQQDQEKAVARAKQDLVEAKNDLTKAQFELEKAKTKTKDEAVKEAQEALTTATRAREEAELARIKTLNSCQRAIDDAWAAIHNVEPDENGDYPSIDYTALRRAEEDYAATQIEQDRAVALAIEAEQKAINKLNEVTSGSYTNEDAIASAEQAVDAAIENIAAKERALSDALDTQESNLETASRSVEDAKNDVEQAQIADQKALNEAAASKQEQQVSVESIELDIETLQKDIAKIEKLIKGGGQYLAEADGVITKISVTVGGKTSEEPFLTMTDEKSGYCFKATLTKDQTKYLKRGDEAQITPAGENKAIEGAVIESMRTLTGEQSGKIEVVVSLPDGVGELGMSATLKVEKLTSQYDVCIPIGALNSDASGNFVLLVREKETVLGTELVAEKVTVRVLDKDRQYAALDGGITSYDQVIVSSAKPVSENDRIRLGT